MFTSDSPIVYIIRDNIHLNSAENLISKALQRGFINIGLNCYIVSSIEEINQLQSNIFIIDDLCNYKTFDDIEKLKNFKREGIVIALWIHWPIALPKYKSMYEDLLLKHSNLFEIFYGEREEISMDNFSELTKREYFVIPNASPEQVLPSDSDKKKNNNFDIAFIGAKYKTKNFLFERVIPQLKKSKSNQISLGFFGKGFNKRVKISNGIIKTVNQIIKPFNKDIAANLNKKVSKLGTVIPESRESLIYKNSKICINYHEDNPEHIIYNMRYFKIPYLGGFQIVDSPLQKSPYFNNDEVIHLSSKKISDWVDTINYYLYESEIRNKIRLKGHLKAKNLHSYSNRARKFMEIYHNLKK